MVNIPIVFEDQNFAIINKPAGIGVHQEQDTDGIVTLMQKQLKTDKLWLVHRLDKVTSGLLILAKTAAAAAQLGESFANRQVQKYYLAIGDKKPKKKQGSVTGDMRKLRDGKWALSKTWNNPAVSQFFSCGLGNGQSLFVVKPHTGKTHQIRVMLKSLGSPIIGDQSYTGSASDRVYLHAYGLQFDFNQHAYEITCMPNDGVHFNQSNLAKVPKSYFTPQNLDWPQVKPINKPVDKPGEKPTC